MQITSLREKEFLSFQLDPGVVEAEINWTSVTDMTTCIKAFAYFQIFEIRKHILIATR